MTQYWKIKSKNYDSIIFFKLGKFYELFFEDAVVCHRVLDLNWMQTNPQKLHVGFPEKNREKYANILVDIGYRVIVVEQVKSVKKENSMDQSTFQRNGGPSQIRPKGRYDGVREAVSRDVCQVLSKGTFIAGDVSKYSSYDPNYVLALKKSGIHIAVSFFDISTNKCFIGQF